MRKRVKNLHICVKSILAIGSAVIMYPMISKFMHTEKTEIPNIDLDIPNVSIEVDSTLDFITPNEALQMYDIMPTEKETRLSYIKQDTFIPSICNVHNDISNTKFNGIEEELNRTIMSYKPYDASIYMVKVDGDTSCSIGYEPDKKIRLASTIKPLYLYPYILMMKENPELWNKKISIQNCWVKGSGNLQYEYSRYQAPNLTIKELVYRAIVDSDNIAYENLRYYFSHSEDKNLYEDTLKRLECHTLLEEKDKIWPSGTAREIAILWNDLYQNRNEFPIPPLMEGELPKQGKKDNYNQSLWDLLNMTDYNYLQNVTFDNCELYCKTGWFGNSDPALNFTGIIQNKNGDSYALVIMTRGSYENAKDRHFIETVGQIMSDMVTLDKSYQKSI